MKVAQTQTRAVVKGLITLGLITFLLLGNLFAWKKKTTGSEGDAAELQLKLSTNQVTIGEKFTVSVLMEYALPQRGKPKIALPKIEEDWGALTLLNYEPQSKWLSRGNIRLAQYQITYTLVSYKVGRFQLPSFESRSYSEGGTATLKRTAAKTIRVNSLLKDSSPEALLRVNPLAEAYPPFAVQGKIAPHFLFALLGSGIFIILLSYLSLRKAKRQGEALLPCEKTLLSLEQLLEKTQHKTTAAAEVRDEKAFHYALSFLMKEFLGNKYKALSLFPLTTQELKKTKLDLSAAEAEFYWTFLEYVDKIKFADKQPEPEKTNFFIRHFKNLLLKEIALSKVVSKKASSRKKRL